MVCSVVLWGGVRLSDCLAKRIPLMTSTADPMMPRTSVAVALRKACRLVGVLSAPALSQVSSLTPESRSSTGSKSGCCCMICSCVRACTANHNAGAGLQMQRHITTVAIDS